MRTYSPLVLLAALGLLSTLNPAQAADTAAWQCKTCPYPKGASGTLEAGLSATSDASAQFGDYTGLQRDRTRLVLGGTLQQRGESGYFADFSAADLGLDSRSLAVRSGHEGQYSLQIGYSELPRHFALGATTPFGGVGSNVLTLPAGFASASTSGMPLAANLHAVDIGFKKKNLSLSAAVVSVKDWTYRVGYSRDVRDGTRATTGSFFASAAQLVAPVDQTTDQIEVSAAYATAGLQASLAYQLSRFSNKVESLTWTSPFWPVVPGATRGQLAQAPDSQLHQIVGSAGYDITPQIRASADFAYGRLTQDASYLAPTLNASLLPSVGAMPAPSLDGRVDSFNGNVKLSAALSSDLKLTATYARNVRDNRSASLAYPQVATDIFVDSQTRNNTPFDFTQDRAKLAADYRGIEGVKLSAGAEQDNRSRNYSEAVKTRETQVWARVGMQPLDNLSLSLKLSQADREHSAYGTAVWFGSVQNPLLRKYNLSSRARDGASLRADLALTETVSVGFSADYAHDRYGDSLVGLQQGNSVSLGADLSASITEQTQLTMYLQGERVRSRQAGSQQGRGPDWSAQNKDQFDVLGLGLRHALVADLINIGADVTISRSNSGTTVFTGNAADPLFPAARVAHDTVKLFASYKLQPQLWLNASLWQESYAAQDWRLDGVMPATVSNLLSFGQQAPHYRVNVVTVSMRYQF